MTRSGRSRIDVLSERSLSGDVLRSLAPKEGEPLPVAVSASTKSERFYLLERKAGWQRVRGLSWVETKEENGKPVSTWQTFFERNIRRCDPTRVRMTLRKGAAPTVEIRWSKTRLQPGKHEAVELTGTFDAKGSYLTTSDGLRLRQISQRAHLLAATLTQDKTSVDCCSTRTTERRGTNFRSKARRHDGSFDAGEFEIDRRRRKAAHRKSRRAGPLRPFFVRRRLCGIFPRRR